MNCKLMRGIRLKKRKDFRRLFEEGSFVSNSFLAVHVSRNPEGKRRIGFTAGKKVGCAVLRNRCKRRLRECYRLNQAAVPKDMDMVLVARRPMVSARWDAVVKAFLTAVQRSAKNFENRRDVSK